MTPFLLAFLAGVLTVATPCILPILPFVMARADAPFRRGGLPLLVGLAVAFSVVASLASVAGGWAVAANQHGRTAALVLMALFGATLLVPALATRLSAPLVAAGDRLSGWVAGGTPPERLSIAASVLLGVATGLVWAPCAGPVLGLILTGAALNGPSVETSALLLTYGLGAATALAAGMLLGRRLLGAFQRSAAWTENLRRVLGVAVIAGAATIWLGLDTGLLTRLSAATTNRIEDQLIGTLHAAEPTPASAPALAGPLAALPSAGPWLNTPPLGPADLRGKVVLVNFWTYSCINCLRSIPHVRAWAEAYRDRGLVVVGVHAPEFAFEKDVANVRKATASLGITWPVALDNDFGVWRAFHNRGWPGLYLVGADGRVRHAAVGEGDYDVTERRIQQLLAEATGAPVAQDLAPVRASGAQAAPDADNLGSPETYVGYQQARNFASQGGLTPDAPTHYRAAASLPLNRWSLDGVWTVGPESARLATGPGRIAFRFHARDLHLVLAPAPDGRPVRFRVTIDGEAPGMSHGVDVDAMGWGAVREDRLYQLVRQTGAIGDRTFEIEFLDDGVRAYAFTFG